MSGSSQGPGWWQSADGMWYPPESSPAPPLQRDPNDPHRGPRAGVLILIGVIVVVAGGVAAVALIAGRHDNSSPYPSAALPTSPPSTNNAVQASNEVGACMQAHQMQYAHTVVHNYSAATPVFLQHNPNPYTTSDPVYSDGSATVTEFESCIWPPSAGADQTGYSQILFTTVPGDTSWPRNFAPSAYADAIDSTCGGVTAQYTGAHTGSSWSSTATVSPGGLATTGLGSGVDGVVPPDGAQGEVPSLSSWAQYMSYEIQPGESVILHEGPENVTAATCDG